MKYLFTILLFFVCLHAFCHNKDSLEFERELELVDKVRDYCKWELGMELPADFYRKWSPDTNAYFYVYVSENNRVKNALPFGAFNYFGKDSLKAAGFISKMDSSGYHTLLYRTYGNTGTELSRHLLSYSEESIAFIVFHEATHLYLRAHAKLPYVFEEATCDLVGNYATKAFFHTRSFYELEKADQQIELIEKIDELINQCLLAAEDSTITGNVMPETENTIKEMLVLADRFEQDRYAYVVNNAFLLRNKSYTQYYFVLKNKLEKSAGIKDFLESMVLLSGSETEILQALSE